MHLKWKVFQHDCASFSSVGEQDHVGCSGRMRLKQIMHSGNGGVERENVSMDVRSSPAGALLRLRGGFALLVGADPSVFDIPTLGFDRAVRRVWSGAPDAGEFVSGTCGVTARPLAERGGRLRPGADVGPADATGSDWGL